MADLSKSSYLQNEFRCRPNRQLAGVPSTGCPLEEAPPRRYSRTACRDRPDGNRERWRNLFTLDPRESVIVWAWRRHSVYRDQYLAMANDPRWRHVTFVRIRSRSDAGRLLDNVSAAPRSPG